LVSVAAAAFMASRFLVCCKVGNGVPSLRAWMRIASVVHLKPAAARSIDTPFEAMILRRSFSASVQTILLERVGFVFIFAHEVRVLAGGTRLLSAHLAASVFIGSTESQWRQTSEVRPVLPVIAVSRFRHFVQRLKSIQASPIKG
jgi:hypothetical protein